MDQKSKPVNLVFCANHVLMECPFCGRTLIKTNYRKITVLLEETDVQRGKVCPKCGNIAVFQINPEGRRIILSRNDTDDATQKISDTDIHSKN